MTFQRARRPEHKRQRYEAILAAARSLAVRDGVRAVSLADIAGAVGMHKSALLRYFETREEIYLRLAADDWREWTSGMRTALADLPPGSVEGVASALATTLAERPLLCDLMTHAPLNLERNVSLEAVRSFKHAAVGSLGEIAAEVRTVLPALGEQDAFELVAAVGMIAAGLWQIGHPTPTVLELYAQEPHLSHQSIPFAPTVARMAETITRGLLVTER
ncbi:TetR family transcriptional regulator [Actinophytocola sp.]|uniref:TetR/AcrR family transcriptional regulator n=1 Tax=Actinophytocola sp. TaxID=1872138 RepID=UPI003D6C2C21